MHNQQSVLRVMRLITLLKTTPKTINHLSHIIETTHRSVYRYIDLIKELGFDVQKNELNRYFIIGDNVVTNLYFTPEEAYFLNQLILSSGKESALKDSILKKIQQKSELNIAANLTIKANLSRIIEQINEGIQLGTQIKLINYHSINTNSISDRIVEPIGFTDNYDALIAYEPTSQKNKFFKIERINKIENTNSPFQYRNKHKTQNPDPFGFAPRTDGLNYTIHLEMSLKAYILMKEEYPLTIPFFKRNENNLYILKLKVNSLKPINRFCMGLEEEVKEIEPTKTSKA